MLARRRVVAVSIALALGTTGCSPQQQQQKPQGGAEVGTQVRGMIQKMALDAEIQRAFLEGRKKTVQSDSSVQAEAYQQNLREQKGMAEEPQIARQMAGVNMAVSEKALADPLVKDRYMDLNLSGLRSITQDPVKRNDLMAILLQAREATLKDGKMRDRMLKDGINESYAALASLNTRPSVLDYQMDVAEQASIDPTQKNA
ncbi:hypothetical protein [Alicyclobacillus dauci]|uniref:SurA N-terminal domain-containing protein n=1 Tax=Alicyclobacillus dauci TaxID=1475485 RepID=A0ABY6Z9I7_9BACL|nr:hypothetical protein [Alicyclobacillus dauci]WAH38750.1 hypothetical protein NZD86_09850 [Alicyclobacillus dauci]